MMKDKNKKLIIVVGVLLLVIGVSFAYFVSQVLIGGNGAKTKMTTASINGATIEVNGTLTFSDLDIYPGHKTASGIELIATGDGEFVPYNLVWNGENSLNTPLKFQVYKSESKIETAANCNKTTKIEDGAQILAEECSITNIDNLGNIIYEGTINKNSNKVVLSNAEFITATNEGTKVYYYVILEYPNLNEEQNIDIGGTFSGKVTVEENNSSADIIIASIYKEEDNNYKEVEEIPEGKYVLNEERSTCTNNAKPTWNSETSTLQVSTLTTSGTECNLYFDIDTRINVDDIIASFGSNLKSGTPDFSQVATGAETEDNNGIYITDDPMYGTNAKTYYWRGAATTNYVKFANFCWRIIRINGDKSIRLIYDGSTCHQNGISTTESIAVQNQAYNSSYNRSEYVGYTFTQGSQRGTTISSNLKSQTDTWYNNIGNNTTYASHVADGKFCNDRNTASGYTWSSQPSSTFYYAGYDRSGANSASSVTPTLVCANSGDVYTLKAGAITMDEVVMAGGKWGTGNSNYYLYNGQYYWTMSPRSWDYVDSSRRWAGVFFVYDNGQFWYSYVHSTHGVRPVINLKSDITFQSGGNGTQSNPYVVAD